MANKINRNEGVVGIAQNSMYAFSTFSLQKKLRLFQEVVNQPKSKINNVFFFFYGLLAIRNKDKVYFFDERGRVVVVVKLAQILESAEVERK